MSRAKPYYIVLTGAESTGKTTLSKALGRKYRCPVVPEAVREFVELRARLPEEQDVFEIARMHLARRFELESNHARPTMVVLDTDLISTVVYQRHYFGSCPDHIKSLSRLYAGDLYLVCNNDFPWQADEGQRESPQVQSTIQDAIIDEMQALSLNYSIIEGQHEERLVKACDKIDHLIEFVTVQ